ncbi:unnamed protein product [Arabis nemorensis]|uniref:Uncharacterized protein n=1 Tax=Arabis nemorensis TaxID=586526 RepID=A0A565BG88_9BRAS|nr:unnamed protein product [Arabis nemorensis]
MLNPDASFVDVVIHNRIFCIRGCGDDGERGFVETGLGYDGAEENFGHGSGMLAVVGGGRGLRLKMDKGKIGN